MSAAGVRALAACPARAEALGAHVVFCRFSGPAADCLDVSGFSQLLDVAETIEDATARLDRSSREVPASACTRAAQQVNYMQAETRPRDWERAAGRAAAPDGDRDLTIWTWLRAAARPLAIVLGLGLGLSGCQVVPGDGPWMGGAQATSTEALPFDVIDLTPTSVVAYAAGERGSPVGHQQAVGRWPRCRGSRRRPQGAHLRALRGQHLPDHPATGADLGTQRVTDEGTINIPYVGSVAGRRPRPQPDRAAHRRPVAGQGAGSTGDRRVRSPTAPTR